jgi:exodeoxyribonuclease VII large subunit
MNQLPLFQQTSMSVSELTRYIKALVEEDEVLSSIWVQGEISNLSRPSSGHIYFTLKDGSAALRCVIWRSSAARLRFGMQNGLAVEAHGAISIYERDGQYQLYVDMLRPAGEGLLYQEFMRLKTSLEAEGLFDPERKRPIPERPARIGIVTSPTGAALQDMLNTLGARYPLAEVILSPCAVQGDAAPREVVFALSCLCTAPYPDVIIVARGGGSLEDLWAFNDEQVVRAIANSPIPVITGIGHETDFTLSDFASDLRAPTPTGAAVMATPDKADLRAELEGLAYLLSQGTLNTISRRWQDLDSVRQRLDWASPGRRMVDERARVEALENRAFRAIRSDLKLRQAHLTGIENRLSALNPAAILKRGFAIVQDSNGRVINRATMTRPGEVVRVQLSEGSLDTRVEQVISDQEWPAETGE